MDGRAYVEDILTSPKVAGRATFMWRGGATCLLLYFYGSIYIYMYVCMCDDDDDELYMSRSVFRRISTRLQQTARATRAKISASFACVVLSYNLCSLYYYYDYDCELRISAKIAPEDMPSVA